MAGGQEWRLSGMLGLRKEKTDNLNIPPLLETEDALASVHQCGGEGAV